MTVLLVEGESDRLALETLAVRRGRDLDAERISIVPMGGSKNIKAFITRLGPAGEGKRLAGLCDAGEESDFRRALESAGLGVSLTRAAMESLGFFVCVNDLEDELIHALGASAVEEVIEAQGESKPFRTLQKQLERRGQSKEARVKKYICNSYRKIRYAGLLVNALDLNRAPRPLDELLAHVE